jgi:hypothetical protein
VEALSRYVAGPLALAAFGLSLGDVGSPVTLVLLVLAAVWAVASLSEWRREHSTLKARAIRVANAVRHCRPRWWTLPPYGEHSSYGQRANVAKHLAQMAEWSDRWRTKVWRPRRPYTKRLHRKIVDTIEELGRVGIQNPHMERFLSEKPTPAEYEDLARDLWWMANKLSS